MIGLLIGILFSPLTLVTFFSGLKLDFMNWVTSSSWATANEINTILADMQASDWSFAYSFTLWTPIVVTFIFIYCRIGNARDRFSRLKRDLWSLTPGIWFYLFLFICVACVGFSMCILFLKASHPTTWSGWHTGVLIIIIGIWASHLCQVQVVGSCYSNGIFCGCQDNFSGCRTQRRSSFSRHGFNWMYLIGINFITMFLQAIVAAVGGLMINTALVPPSIIPMLVQFVFVIQIAYLWYYNGGQTNCRNTMQPNFVPTYSNGSANGGNSGSWNN